MRIMAPRLPVHVLLRGEGAEHPAGQQGGGEVEADAVHPGVLVELRQLVHDLHTRARTHAHAHTHTHTHTQGLEFRSI